MAKETHLTGLRPELKVAFDPETRVVWAESRLPFSEVGWEQLKAEEMTQNDAILLFFRLYAVYLNKAGLSRKMLKRELGRALDDQRGRA